MKGEWLNKSDLRYIKSILIVKEPKKVNHRYPSLYVDCHWILHYKKGTLIINK